MQELFLTNTLTRAKERFIPIDQENIRIYACGPTVYQRPHIGNLRSAIVVDFLVRIISLLYRNVTYVRNITDVNDKIENEYRTIVSEKHFGAENRSIYQMIDDITTKYHADLDALWCIKPKHEPRVSGCIPEIIELIKVLIERGCAYVVQTGPSTSDVFFSLSSDPYYGCLSNRSVDDMESEREVANTNLKRHKGDFALWKSIASNKNISNEDEKFSDLNPLLMSFDSPWGNGVPGWHIECSAMSAMTLGNHFDIHCGGIDIVFPHHENERAQSSCAHGIAQPVNYWVHNGLLTINGEKMSKSEGNILTLDDIRSHGISMSELKYFLLSIHYRKPLDYNEKSIGDVKKFMNKIRTLFKESEVDRSNISLYRQKLDHIQRIEMMKPLLNIICDDFNSSKVHALLNEYIKTKNIGPIALYLDLIGINDIMA